MSKKEYVVYAVKILLSVYIVYTVAQGLFADGLKPYVSYKDYNCQNEFTQDQVFPLSDVKEVSQVFTAKGNHLNNVSIYLGDTDSSSVYAAIYNEAGSLIADSTLDLSDYTAHAWNGTGLGTARLKRGDRYTISLSCENGLAAVYCSNEEAPDLLGECTVDGTDSVAKPVVGFCFTHTYLTLGGFFEITLKIIYSLFMCSALCFGIFRIEKIYDEFRNTREKKGFTYALYLSVSLSFLYYPLDLNRNSVTEFHRVIGGGLIANRDISKRIANFRHWFFFFAIVFILFILLSNYFLNKDKSEECRKVESFLDDLMILANCSLIFRCITYFNDKAELSDVYQFSTYALMMSVMTAGVYILLRLDRYISANYFARLQLMGVCVSIPISIYTASEWDQGKVLLGINSIVSICIIIFCKYGKKLIDGKYFCLAITTGVLTLSLIPLCTSCYIELIHVLNQYKIFVAYPEKQYKYLILLIMIVWLVLVITAKKKQWGMAGWKKWSFPGFIIGVSCLSVQIPISSTYNVDLMERANSSILISDFLNYGKIPIVEHYGGHMMTSVWEGIIYGVINNDRWGAMLSPYSVMIVPILVLMFYFLVSMVWNRNIALFVVLFCPFYDFWNYYGVGMLVCLATVAYIKKGTYTRAALLWAVVIWCVIYRLDLGFAFAVSVIISLAIYMAAAKEWVAIKKLGLTLAGWGVVGCAIWTVICLIKDINPINRLIEFLMISSSNQNWAYKQIGNPSNLLFGWTYMLIPFAVVVCLVYTIFSKNMRERIGMEKWVLLLIFGWAYFANFSRGLVRHSLVEMTTFVVSWSSYLFLAFFLSSFLKKNKLFLPLFLLLNLCNEFLINGENYTEVSIADNAVSSPEVIIDSWKPERFAEDGDKTYWECLKQDQEVVKRVALDEETENYVNKYEIVLDILLEDGDTFVDFINKTMLYSILGIENPVYVSQSPLQLSGEFTQEEYMKEINGIPIILMPADADNYKDSNSLDGISNTYRYYKVSEYIYRNYMPLCRYGNDFAVWCLKESYDNYAQKLSEALSETENAQEIYAGLETVSYGYDGPVKKTDENSNVYYEYIGALHNNYLEHLPGIWAEYDSEDAVHNPVTVDLEEQSGMYLFDSGVAISAEKGNYLKIRATYDGMDEKGYYADDDEYLWTSIVMGTYQDGEFIERCRYQIALKEGEHDYLIRCSTDYYWYLGLINAVKVEADGIFRNVKMEILEGD